jgi:hypothetical protein
MDFDIICLWDIFDANMIHHMDIDTKDMRKRVSLRQSIMLGTSKDGQNRRGKSRKSGHRAQRTRSIDSNEAISNRSLNSLLQDSDMQGIGPLVNSLLKSTHTQNVS